MRRLYAFTNRNPALPVQTYDDDVENVRIVRSTNNNVVQNENKVIVRKTTSNIVESHNTDVNYVETDNVYLNETGRCPYVRCPWWLWLLLALGLLSLLGLALGLGLGLGLRDRTVSVNSRCSGSNCPANSQCINNRCECNSGYFYDYSISACDAYLHVGMTCTTSNTNQQCITNAHCASNGYCICDTDYFLDQVDSLLIVFVLFSDFIRCRITANVRHYWLVIHRVQVMINANRRLSVPLVFAIAIKHLIMIRARIHVYVWDM